MERMVNALEKPQNLSANRITSAPIARMEAHVNKFSTDRSTQCGYRELQL